MSKAIVIIVFILAVSIIEVYSNSKPSGEIDCIPTWAIKSLDQSGFFENLSFSPQINPLVIEGDFNHDQKVDIAIVVRERGTGKKGIAIVHQGQSETQILGAGYDFGSGGKNWEWMDQWNIAKTHNNDDGIFVSKSESASALIFWDGKKYVWEQWGD